MHKLDREQGFATTALALMGEHAVAPTPENFELFHAYASGENPAIAQVIAAVIAAGIPLGPDTLHDLRLRCLPNVRAARNMDVLSTGMHEIVDTVLGKLTAAGRDAVTYKNALSAATGELGGTLADGRSPEEMRKLVDGLIAATGAMEQRTRNLESELQRSCGQVEELRCKLDDVRKECLTDPLTGIPNRRAFDDAVCAAVADMADKPEAVTLLICDIDHFKTFNDNWGHQTGDQVLRLVANCLSENVKGRDTAARYGGEEFTVLLRATGLADATRLADQIRGLIETKKLVKKSTGNILGTITVSIGVAQFAPGESAEHVIRRADACLYGAKHHGRNQVMNQDDPRLVAAA